MRRGPLVVYAEDEGIVRAVRNIPGVNTINVNRLNLLHLAPGGNIGRFLIWTESAFKQLNAMYGTHKSGAPLKKNYTLPRSMMENADVARIINSNEVQSVLRPKIEAPKRYGIKKNPLKNKMVMARLHPGINQKVELRKREHAKTTEEQKAVQGAKTARLAEAKKYNKVSKKGDSTFYKSLMAAFEAKANEGKEVAEEEEE